jgi:hypothetical protein
VDPIQAILTRLEAIGNVETLSIFSHGDQGALYLSGKNILLEELQNQADQWRRLGEKLAEGGDIQLFGCHIAAGEAGRAFIAKLASLTGADVAASINPTGNPESGGDWVLEAIQGDIDPRTVLNPSVLSEYKGILAWSGTIDFSHIYDAGASYSLNGPALNASVYAGAGSNYILVGDGLRAGSYIDSQGDARLGTFYVHEYETRLNLYFLNGETFNATSIDIENCGGTQHTLRVTSSASVEETTTITLDDQQVGTVDLSGFSSALTSLSITNDAGGELGCFYVDNFVVTDVRGNTAPALGGTFTTAGSVDDNATLEPFGSVTVSDADGDHVSLSITYNAANGALSGTGLSGSEGNYTLSSAAPATLTTNLQALVFTPTENQVAAGYTVVSTFTLTPNDGRVDGASDATTQVIAMSSNDNPVITSNGAGASGATSVNENSVTVTTVNATDPDPSSTLNYSISGADAGAFLIDSSSGVLTFRSVPNYESPTDSDANNTYDVQVTVTDDGPGALTDVQALAVSVNNINENPHIISNGGGATASVSLEDAQTAVTTVSAIDQDSADTLTYTISGGLDAALFRLNPTTGVLSFLTAPAYSAPQDSGANNVYDVQVTVTDSGVGNLTDVQDIAISVTAVSSPPGGTLSISGTPEEDQTLTAVNNITDSDGLGAFSYQWRRDSTAIPGATTNSYTLGDDDVGHTLTVSVSYTDGGGTAERVTSDATPVIANVNDLPAGAVIISGDVVQGQMLSADTSSLSDTDGLGAFSYHWFSGSSELVENSGTYILTADDVGNQISVMVSYVDGQGTVENITSELTLAVIGAGDDTPVVLAPEDITLNATGLFTEVDVGMATATDPEDGELTPSVTQIVSNGVGPTPLDGIPVHFSPGNHQLSWSVTDSDENTSVATQDIHVVPMVSFSKDQVSAEGETAQFKLILNGPAVEYPVTIPYTLSGSMLSDGSDHDLIDGSAIIDTPALEALISVSFVDDGANEGPETLIITMGSPENATIGPVTTHQIDVLEENVAPSAKLLADQNGAITRLVGQADGQVILMAVITDPNQQDEHSYDWSATDNRLIDIDTDESRFTFDPVNLEPDTYVVRLTVNDGSVDGEAELQLNVIPALPELSDQDSDNDGVDDSEEGSGDNDGDGIPNFLDHLETARNVIQEQQGDAQEFLMETEPGLEFLLGDVAFRAHGESTRVSVADIERYGNDGAGAVADEESNDYPGGLFDFRIASLPVSGQSVDVVIPQFAPIPENAVYRKLMPTGWQDYVIDDNNRIASSAGSAGYCPPPGDVSYTEGLTNGNWCVQLTIEDGGPNDGDMRINSKVEDPGGVSHRASDTGSESKGGGGGYLSLVSLFLFFLLLLKRQLYYLARQKDSY